MDIDPSFMEGQKMCGLQGKTSWLGWKSSIKLNRILFMIYAQLVFEWQGTFPLSLARTSRKGKTFYNKRFYDTEKTKTYVSKYDVPVIIHMVVFNVLLVKSGYM